MLGGGGGTILKNTPTAGKEKRKAVLCVWSRAGGASLQHVRNLYVSFQFYEALVTLRIDTWQMGVKLSTLGSGGLARTKHTSEHTAGSTAENRCSPAVVFIIY